MKINIIAVGNRMPTWVQTAFQDYAKRFPSESAIQLVEITPEKSTNQNNTVLLEREGNKIQAQIRSGTHTIALDIQGSLFDTQKFAQKFELWSTNHPIVNFVIGGPLGLSAKILQASDERLSLSPLTLPHPLVRVLLIEQLYRAYTIQKNHPYHRE